MNPRIETYPHIRRRHEDIHTTPGRSRHGTWGRTEYERIGKIERYGREDKIVDQLGQLPSREFVRLLISRLRQHELREFTEGVVNDVTDAVKKGDNLESAKAINSWIATAEEPISSRRKTRHVLAARARGRASS